MTVSQEFLGTSALTVIGCLIAESREQRAGSGFLNSFPRMISGVPPGFVC